MVSMNSRAKAPGVWNAVTPTLKRWVNKKIKTENFQQAISSKVQILTLPFRAGLATPLKRALAPVL